MFVVVPLTAQPSMGNLNTTHTMQFQTQPSTEIHKHQSAQTQITKYHYSRPRHTNSIMHPNIQTTFTHRDALVSRFLFPKVTPLPYLQSVWVKGLSITVHQIFANHFPSRLIHSSINCINRSPLPQNIHCTFCLDCACPAQQVESSSPSKVFSG